MEAEVEAEAMMGAVADWTAADWEVDWTAADWEAPESVAADDSEVAADDSDVYEVEEVGCASFSFSYPFCPCYL